MLEDDLNNTSSYVEPQGQEDTFSFEFDKLLILSCTEVESVFKMICKAINSSRSPKIMPSYQEIILDKFPKIETTQVNVPRLGRNIYPFKNWSSGSLSWWNAYQVVKYNRKRNFDQATYISACSARAISITYIAFIFMPN